MGTYSTRFGLGLLVVVVASVVLSAHMALQKSLPEEGAVLSASPDTIRLWFTQDPDPAVAGSVAEAIS